MRALGNLIDLVEVRGRVAMASPGGRAWWPLPIAMASTRGTPQEP
jgi:hypothetical protein